MARKSRTVSDEVKQKISSKMKGRKVSEETRRKMSEAQKKAWSKVKQQSLFDDERVGHAWSCLYNHMEGMKARMKYIESLERVITKEDLVSVSNFAKEYINDVLKETEG